MWAVQCMTSNINDFSLSLSLYMGGIHWKVKWLTNNITAAKVQQYKSPIPYEHICKVACKIQIQPKLYRYLSTKKEKDKFKTKTLSW